MILDDNVLKKIKNRDPSIFEKIFKEYGDKVYNFLIIKVNGNKNVAEDLLSETFISAIKSAPGLKNINKIQSWLLQIALKRFYDHLRKKFREQKHLESNKNMISWDSEEKIENDIENEKKLMLNIALDKIKPIYKDILVLMYIEERSRKEISQTFNKSLSSIENLLYRAREALKKELKKISKDFTSG